MSERQVVDEISVLGEELPSWANRFFAITPDLGVSFCLVFSDAAAQSAQQIEWPEGFCHHEPTRPHPQLKNVRLPPSCKLYLGGECEADGEDFGNQFFSFSEGSLREKLARRGLQIGRCEWTLMRFPWAKAFCMRESEILAAEAKAEKPAKWGFGREHPVKSYFRPHKLLAGPLIDFPPGQAPEKFGEGWRFEPILVKAAASEGAEPYMILVGSEWLEDGSGVRFWVRQNDLVAPKAIEEASL